jgi:hypothetical protein
VSLEFPPISVTLAVNDRRVAATLGAWMRPGWESISIGAVVASPADKQTIFISDVEARAQDVVRARGPASCPILVSGDDFRVWDNHLSTWRRPLRMSVRRLQGAVVVMATRAHERTMLKHLEERRADLGSHVVQYVRQLLLEPVPHLAVAMARDQAGEDVFLRSMAYYAEGQSVAQRTLQAHFARCGLKPQDIRGLVLMRAVAEAKLRLTTAQGVATSVGFASGSSLARFLARVADCKFGELEAEHVGTALNRLARLLNLGSSLGRKSTA